MFALNIFCLGVMRRLDVVCSHVAPEQRSAEANTAMPAQLVEELRAMRSVRAFNPRAWIDSKVDKLNEYMRKGKLSGCVVSVSGGIDSAVTYALMIEASKKANSPIKKTVGIAQPIHSTASVWKRAYELLPLGGTIITVDQTKLYDDLSATVQKAAGLKGGSFADGQLRSYMRTPVNYYVAQLLSANGNLSIVLGTGNYDEDGYLRYFCKAGDGTVDVQLIADLHKSEVFAVARELKVPNSILVAPPTADLWEGQTDENEMGFSYDFVELYTTFLQFDQAKKNAFLARLKPEAKEYFLATGDKARQIHERNAHKASWPINI